jgi:LysR family transcriptional regulator, glycine cleavage system transcriptional activator
MSFSKAAEELLVTQSAVSHAVKQLELALGMSLFVRKHRSLELTAEGETLYRSVNSGLALIADTIKILHARSPETSELVVAGSTSMIHFWMLPRVTEFQHRFPGLKLKLQTLDKDLDVTEAGIDVFLRLGDGRWPQYDTIKVWPEEIFAVASPDYLERSMPIRALTDLMDHDLIVYEDLFRRRMKMNEWFLLMGAQRPCPNTGRLHLTDYAVALQAAIDGCGITLGWRPSIDDLVASKKLALAFPTPLVTGNHFYLVTPRGASTRPPLSTFCDWLVETATRDAPIEGQGGNVVRLPAAHARPRIKTI